MRWFSILAIYLLFWFLSLFAMLPIGIRTTREAGGEPVPGQADSAPHEFRVGRLAKRVTVVATILFLLFQINYYFGWIGPQLFDFSGAGANSFD